MRPHHSSSMHLGGYPPPPHQGQLGPRHGSMPYEGSSNGYPAPSSSRYPSGSNSYYYSSTARPPPLNTNTLGNNSAVPSPSAHSYRTNTSVERIPQHHSTSTMPGRRGGSVGPPPVADVPTYQIEHLATFAVGRTYGLLNAQDGIRKLKQMEKQSAIWAQPLLLKLWPDRISVEDENEDVVEAFPMHHVIDPTAHQSHDNSDAYNNILLFVVRSPDEISGKRGSQPATAATEMHIFQCVRVSAVDVAQDILYYTRGMIHKVRGGRRDTGYGGSFDASPPFAATQQNFYRDDASPSSNSSEAIDVNVNTLNKCFDDIERFVARIQSAGQAQRELEAQQQRLRGRKARKNEVPQASILALRAQFPTPDEFYEIFQKFKLSFNILTMVKDYIHDPNAPDLLHHLFKPLMGIVDASHYGHNKNIAADVVSPLLSSEAYDLLRNCLNSKEFDVWMALGPNWRTTPEDWNGPLPAPYRPVFRDNFAPYGYPPQRQLPPQREPFPQPAPSQAMHRGSSAPPPQHYVPPRKPQRSVDDIDMERVNLEKERIAFERMKIIDRERRLAEEEQRLQREEQRLAAERELMRQEARLNQQRVQPVATSTDSNVYIKTQPSPVKNGTSNYDANGMHPRMRSFLADLHKHGRKVVEVTYDRVKQHDKELTVIRGEYLEVLNDEKNWWECRNSQSVTGFVPHTILSLLTADDVATILRTQNNIIDPESIPQRNPPAYLEQQSLSPRPGMMSDDTPDYIKQRQGKRGEFRYF
uniref:SH3 domain-containing protein n=1 Tax=Panagrellus redivivus TaxID=6233 RepID=A0A7E4VW10_PANRE